MNEIKLKLRVFFQLVCRSDYLTALVAHRYNNLNAFLFSDEMHLAQSASCKISCILNIYTQNEREMPSLQSVKMYSMPLIMYNMMTVVTAQQTRTNS